MAYRSSSSLTTNFADVLVNQKGSGTQAIVGIIILIIGIGVGQVLKNDLVTYIYINICWCGYNNLILFDNHKAV